MRLAFADTAAIVEIPDSEELLAALRAAAPGWEFAETGDGGDPVATVRISNGAYEIDLPGEDPIEATAVSAACSTMVDVVGAYIAENPGRLCFHCGAAEFAGRLVVFPSRWHAGKSTLIGRLAASGHVIYGDDMLPVSDDDRSGVALGIAPRLRLPLPEKASASFRRFVAEHTAASDGRYLYLRLPEGGLAPRDSAAPLGAIVLLDRRPEGPAVLGHASRSAILQSLIVQNFARMAPAAELLDRLHKVMDRLPRLVLRYSDLEEAAALLDETFREWPLAMDAFAEPMPWTLAARTDEDSGTADPPESIHPPETRLWQNPQVGLHAVEGELFLADAEGTSIHHLNAMGSGLWNLLAEPTSRNEAVEILCGAFPDVDRQVVERDVARLFSDLSRKRFILPADE